MSESKQGIFAVFKYLDHVCDAIEKVKDREDCEGHEIFSPTSYHEIEQAAGFKSSPVRFFTLAGGLTGCVTGFALALVLDYDYPLTVGGKQAGIMSLPAYVIIGFELTILFGALMTILGILIMGRIPNPKIRILDKRMTDDLFGIFVPNATLDGPQAKLLKDCGAMEVRTEEG